LPRAWLKGKGFSLPDGAVKIDDDRYRLSQTWDEALKWYKGQYPPAKFPRRTLHSQTNVRAIHISNPAGGEWEGREPLRLGPRRGPRLCADRQGKAGARQGRAAR